MARQSKKTKVTNTAVIEPISPSVIVTESEAPIVNNEVEDITTAEPIIEEQLEVPPPLFAQPSPPEHNIVTPVNHFGKADEIKFVIELAHRNNAGQFVEWKAFVKEDGQFLFDSKGEANNEMKWFFPWHAENTDIRIRQVPGNFILPQE